MTSPLRRALVGVGHRVLRLAPVGNAATRMAAARQRRLALVFHRITAGPAAPGGIVTRVSDSTFREQLEVLLELGDVVPLTALLETAAPDRPRFALTFDDDWVTHHDVVLPILLELELTATFFLCGRALHGLGPMWFEVLDELLLEHGAEGVARLLDVPAGAPGAIGVRSQRDPLVRRRLAEIGADVEGPLDRRRIGALARAGMTIGFHTLHHPYLPDIPDEGIDVALAEGRFELEAASGTSLELFAYPHGAADRRVAARVRAARFRAAWTGRQHPMSPGDDPFALGRWEPGPLGRADFRARVAANLNGWARS